MASAKFSGARKRLEGEVEERLQLGEKIERDEEE